MPPFRPRRSLRPVRPRLTRRALVWYLAAGALTVLTAVVVDSAISEAEAAQAALGTMQPVAVVARVVEAGDEIRPDDIAIERWPIRFIPPGAAAEAPIGRVALDDLHPGEPVVASRLGDEGTTGPAALLADGQRALPVPVVVPGLPLAVGDRVDVVAGGGLGGGPTGDLPVAVTRPDLVATDAAVVAVGDESVVVAVSPAEAADVAAALTAGPVILTLRPPGG